MRPTAFTLLCVAPVAAILSPTRPGLALLAAAMGLAAATLLLIADHNTRLERDRALDELDAIS